VNRSALGEAIWGRRVSEDPAVKNPAKTAKRRPRGKSFEAGAPSANPAGRPRGSRNKSTLMAEALLAGEAEQILRKAVELAKGGDVSMIRALLAYILPAKPHRVLTLTLPPIETASDALMVSKMIVEKVASGDLSPAEGSDLSKTIELHIRLFEVVDLETRLAQLEAQRGLH
jgi:hypothetical protein